MLRASNHAVPSLQPPSPSCIFRGEGPANRSKIKQTQKLSSGQMWFTLEEAGHNYTKNRIEKKGAVGTSMASNLGLEDSIQKDKG